MSTTNSDLDAIRTRLALTVHFGTDWTYDDRGDGWTVSYETDHPQAGHLATIPDYAEAVTDLLVHAPCDLTVLLAEVDRLRDELRRVRRDAEEAGARRMREQATLAADHADTAAEAAATIRGLPLRDASTRL